LDEYEVNTKNYVFLPVNPYQRAAKLD